MPDADISVIICAYTEDRWDDIVGAVDSLEKQTYPPREIILVIDHNAALFTRAVADIRGARVIENTSPRGLSGARNSGLAIATGAFVAFLDDDAYAAPDWLEHLHAQCNASDVLGAGGWVEANWVDHQPAWFPDEFLWVVGCSYRGLPRATAVVRNPFGGCSCIRREVFDRVGGFRTEIGRIGTLPLGCEETELSIERTSTGRSAGLSTSPGDHPPQGSALPAARCATSRRAATPKDCRKPGWHAASVRAMDWRRSGVTRRECCRAGWCAGCLTDCVRRDNGGFLRAAAIVVGLAFTSAGYVRRHAARVRAEKMTSSGCGVLRW